MSNIFKNLVYRVSVSAIIGALVAGGLVYLNTERVNRGLRTDMVSYNKYRMETDANLMQANADLLETLAAMKTELAETTAALSAQIEALNTTIAAMPSTPMIMMPPNATGTTDTLEAPTPAEIDPISDNELGDIIKIIPAPAITPEN